MRHTLDSWNIKDVANACFCKYETARRYIGRTHSSLSSFIDNIILFRIFRKNKLLTNNHSIEISKDTRGISILIPYALDPKKKSK